MYTLRAYDPERGNFYTVQMTFEDIIKEPYMLHSEDVAYALLTELRKERGLEPLPKNSYGEQNG